MRKLKERAKARPTHLSESDQERTGKEVFGTELVLKWSLWRCVRHLRLWQTYATLETCVSDAQGRETKVKDDDRDGVGKRSEKGAGRTFVLPTSDVGTSRLVVWNSHLCQMIGTGSALDDKLTGRHIVATEKAGDGQRTGQETARKARRCPTMLHLSICTICITRRHARASPIAQRFSCAGADDERNFVECHSQVRNR